MMKKLRYLMEYALLLVFFAVCKLLPWRVASKMGATLLGSIGPHLAASRKARRHIEYALPDMAKGDVTNTVKAMWRNLGHILAEYPHLKTIATHHTHIDDPHHVLDRFRDDGQAGIMFGAHFSNWEVMPVAVLMQKDLALNPVYRAPNNPMVDRLLHRLRSMGKQLTPFDKSRKGMIGMARAMADGAHLGLLIDQKYNEGVEAQFFNRPAMTSTAFIELCQRYKAPLATGHLTRQHNGDYSLKIEDMIKVFDDDGTALPVEKIMAQAHMLIERWITQNPGQWLWLHRRWKDEG